MHHHGKPAQGSTTCHDSIRFLFFLNQLPYLRTASIKPKRRCFSAAHCRGNAPSTLSKYTLRFPSLILMVHSSVGIFLFQRANCFLHLRGEGRKQVELQDHKMFAMKPGDLLLIPSMSSEIFNKFFWVTISKSSSTSQTNRRITAASYCPAISESFLSSCSTTWKEQLLPSVTFSINTSVKSNIISIRESSWSLKR